MPVSPPATLRKAVTDEYHGVKVNDEYRWLENAAAPDVQSWVASQNRYTRSLLDGISAREQILSRLRTLYVGTSPDYYSLRFRRGVFFALKWQPPKNQAFLVSFDSLQDQASERVIVDPNALDTSASMSIDFYVPSLNGRLAAVCLSKGGSEDGTVHVYEVDTGRELEDRVPRANYPTAGGSVAWNADASGFYYTRYPKPGERPDEDLHFFQQVYFHRIGVDTSEDKYVIGEEFPRIAETVLQTTGDGKYMLATVANGDGGEFAHYLMDDRGGWTKVTEFSDKATRAALGTDGCLYLLSRNGSPRGRILKVPLSNPKMGSARPIVEHAGGSIESFVLTKNRLYVTEVDGGPSRLLAYDLDGRPQGKVPIEDVSVVDEVVKADVDTILYRNESFVTPPAWHAYDPSTGKAVRTRLAVVSPADYRDCEVAREYAKSKDGTIVPLSVIRRRGTKLDGKNPVLLGGYGGYGLSSAPYFQVRRIVWLEKGGVVAVANVRGGGEYGEEWHKAGMLTKKQNVFDDFIACAEHLIRRGYTTPERLAIEGGSNGGILMAASFTQRPELFRAVVSHVGIYDMLRVELDPNGAFNVTEFGTVKQPDQFRAMFAYSPYHRVVSGVPYPAVLMAVGENDGRVNPLQSRKMVARLQAASSSGRPILLRTSSASGHGFGTALDEMITLGADVFAFLFDQVGLV
jgi:prolyl oligopeptidase